MGWKEFIPGSDADKDKAQKSTGLKEATYTDASGNVEQQVNPTNRFPWCVVVVDGIARCYKGSVWGSDKDSETKKTHIKVTGTVKSKIRVFGSSVGGGGAGQSLASGETSGSPQQAWPPTFDAGGTTTKKRDPEPEDYGILNATNGKLIGNGAFESGYNAEPWFQWTAVAGRLWLKGNPDEEGKLKWGLFYEVTGTTAAKYAFLVADIQADGTVLQYLKSDLFVPDDATVTASHPFKVTSQGGEIIVAAGTVNNIILDESLHEGGGTTYVYVRWQYDVDTDEPLSDPEVGTYATVHACDDENFYLLVAEVIGDTVNQFVTGSLWVDRMRMGDQAANYYVARI